MHYAQVLYKVFKILTACLHASFLTGKMLYATYVGKYHSKEIHIIKALVWTYCENNSCLDIKVK